MGEKIPEEPPATERRHRAAKAARNTAAEAAKDDVGTERKLPREHDDDRSPADPNDWQDEWDRARWAP